jgi:hypothetical protein
MGQQFKKGWNYSGLFFKLKITIVEAVFSGIISSNLIFAKKFSIE